jgi:hypothetical protein
LPPDGCSAKSMFLADILEGNFHATTQRVSSV